jgi:hypothetical protein
VFSFLLGVGLGCLGVPGLRCASIIIHPPLFSLHFATDSLIRSSSFFDIRVQRDEGSLALRRPQHLVHFAMNR